MKLHAEKEGILYTLLLVSFLVFAVQGVNAQSFNSCCIDEAGHCSYDEDTTAQTCNGVFNSTHSCNNIPDCNDVCCRMVLSGTCVREDRAACERDENAEITFLPLDQCNQNYCNSNTVLIQGSVRYYDSILASGADVKVFNPSGAEVASVKTGDNGMFVVPVSKSSAYSITISASLNSACSVQKQVAVGESDYTMEDITLNCLSPSSGCMTKWETGPWSDTTCGFRTVVVSPTDSCGRVTLENKPAEFMPCSGESSCGNNVRESNEACDVVNGVPTFSADKDSCADFGSNMRGRVTCSAQCQVITDCVSCSGECTDQRMCTYCEEECAGEPLCGSGCSASEKINDFIAYGTYENRLKGITLEWDIPETCASSTVKIFRCEGNNEFSPNACATGSAWTFVNSVSGADNLYTDTSFPQSSKSFCYNISTTINNGFEVLTIYSSTLACSPVWDDACINNPNEPVCSGKRLVVCQNGKVQMSLSKDCSCGCRGETSTTPAACVGTDEDCNACDVCSGPYGLFPYKDYELSEIYDNAYYSCASDLRSRLGEEKMCYLDDYSKNKAIIGQYHACAEVSSCYDYRTESSCESNPCGITAVEEGNCRWTSLTENNELGLGVCVPSNPEEQDCTKCGEKGILGNYCPEELCVLYGRDAQGKTTCHYNSVTRYPFMNIDNSSCMNIEDVACETYDSKEECLGAQELSFNADIIYDSNGLISGGTNAVSQRSGDLLNKGKCIWAEETRRCIKDSDMSSKIDDYSFDCNRDECLKDFINPETTLFVLDRELNDGDSISVEELKLITFKISEQMQRQNRNTFIAASDSGSVFPQYNLYLQRTELINDVIEMGTGEVYLYFYSMDDSRNREEIKSLRLNLIPSLQGRVGVDVSTNSQYYENSDIFLTDVDITVSHDRNLRCEPDLRNVLNNQNEIAGGIPKSGTNLQWTYSYLPDGSYQLNINCVDDNLQTFVYSEEILVDSDMSLHNVYPRGGTFRGGNVEIGLSTNASAVCYYTTNKDVSTSSLSSGGSASSAWTAFDSTGGTEHSSTVNVDRTGLNFFYPACYFEELNDWFTFTSGDVIYFGVDNLPPEIRIYDQDTGAVYQYLNATLTDFVSLRIQCEDNASVLTSGAKSYAFGCGESSITVSKYYQSFDSEGRTINVDTERINSGDIYDVFAPENYVKVYLNVTATDKGGNSRSVIQQINVRNLSFLEPIVTICDLELGICS